MSTYTPSFNIDQIAGASFSRAELLERAKHDPQPAWFKGNDNDNYLKLVDHYQGATVGDIMTTADQADFYAYEKAKTGFKIMLGGGACFVVGLSALNFSGFSLPLPLAMGLYLAGGGATIVGGAISLKAECRSLAARDTTACTAAWGQLMADEAKTKTQPAPAPASPAPATVPAQQPAHTTVAA